MLDNATQRPELVYRIEEAPEESLRSDFFFWLAVFASSTFFVVALFTTPRQIEDKLYHLSGPENPRFNVVFVHGVEGHYENTWRYKNCFWPDWIAEDFPDAAVWSFQYSAALSHWTGHTMTLLDRAVSFLFHLQAEELWTRPIIFIAHSFGGLVIEKLWRNLREQHEWEKVRAIRGAIFLGTPFAGSMLANYTKLLPRFSLRRSTTMKELEHSDSQLRELSDIFRKHPIPKVCVYYETQRLKGSFVVDQASANPGIPGVTPVPVDGDHISMCKPRSRDNYVVKLVKQSIQEMMLGESPRSTEPDVPPAKT